MKIDDTYQNITLVSGTNESTGKKKPEEVAEDVKSTEKGTGSGAEVDFSSTSVEVSKAAALAAKEQPGRAQKVEEIATKVQEGTYDVNSSQVAEAIVRESLANIVEP